MAPSPRKTELDIIYETEQQQKRADKILKSSGEFKQNMILSFYNWPKIETSAVQPINQNSKRNVNGRYEQNIRKISNTGVENILE